MARCNICGRKGFFLSVNIAGHCEPCSIAFAEAQSRLRVFNDSVRLALEGKTHKTRLSRCDLAMEHAQFFAHAEASGARFFDRPATEMIKEIGELRQDLFIQEARAIYDATNSKAEVASTPKVKERAYAAAAVKLKELNREAGNLVQIAELEHYLTSAIHRVTLEGFLEAARKAEFKGNTKKALDQYQEALFFLRNDNIDDQSQADEIRHIEAKIASLQAGA